MAVFNRFGNAQERFYTFDTVSSLNSSNET